jgi:dTDP-4-amino-4,6-dideoxy-D-galactose acyltransferase
MSLTRLDWDSDFFDLNIGLASIKVFSMEIDSILSEIYQSDFDLTYLFSKSYSNKKPGGLTLRDTKLLYRKPIKSLKNINNNVVSYNGELNEELIHLALESGVYSRYKLDPHLNLYFNKLYIKWLENSLNRSFADEVFIAKNKLGIQGLITLKKENYDSAKIGLISVKSDSRGLGIGRELINAAENWTGFNKLKYLKVATQELNLNASSFYENMEFNLIDTDYIFHIWKKNS